MKNSLSKLKRKGITTKAIRAFLSDPQWTKDETATDFLKEDVYRHPDGRVFYTFSDDTGCLYETKQDFEQFIEIMKQVKSIKSATDVDRHV